jgi:hypothetical protein
LGYLNGNILSELGIEIEEIGRMINGFRNYVSKE